MTTLEVRPKADPIPEGAVAHPTFCHICEAVCGVVAWVKDNQVVKIQGDKDNPFSKGYVCPKGVVEHHVTHDPDRVLQPLRRQPDGTFAPVAWEEALDDIGARLRRVIDRHGPDAVAGYLGNPSAWNYSLFFALFSLIKGLGSPHLYTAGSVDIQQRWVVNHLLYGNPFRSPVPDLPRTDFHLLVGSNPFVSHGSMCTQPRVREAMLAIPKRGGRVVVVDPRRTETAEAFEWLPIRADTDAWMLASLLHVLFAEDLYDRRALAEDVAGLEPLRAFAAAFPPEETEAYTGIPADRLRTLARDFAAAPSAAIHGRCGASLGQYSTLVAYLLDAVALVTGNWDKPGGSVFGRPAIDLEKILELFGAATYDTYRSRISGIPEVIGTLPAVELPAQITTPGKGQIRALFVASANIATSTPGAGDVGAALDDLELSVCFDLYRTETAEHCDYILPDVTVHEREDFPWFVMQHMTRPYMQWTKAELTPAGDARPAGWAIDQIARRAKVIPNPLAAGRLAYRLGIRPTPAQTMDLFLRLGRHGDLFGLRRKGLRLNRKKLLANPHGFRTDEFIPTGWLRQKLTAKGGRVRLDPPVVLSEMDRLRAHDTAPDPTFGLRLVSLRELRSQNSRLHNIDKIMRNRTQRLRMHPSDAEAAGVADGDLVAVVSKRDRIEVPVTVTDEMLPGNVALPQGWGHGGGWRTAVAAGGANYNRLVPTDPSEVDQPSGNARFNGIPVRVERVG